MTSTAQNDKFSLPISTDLCKLTRSEHLFSIAAKINIHSLTILTDVEFYLFIKMQVEQQWVSHCMTSHKWVSKTNKYNRCLKANNKKQSTVFKNPRALLDKLEAEVMKRLTTRNFTCEWSNNHLILWYS